MSVADKLGFGPKREVMDNGDGTWTIKVTPGALSGETKPCSVVLTKDQYDRYQMWREGSEMIQVALPDLSPSKRDALLMGIET